MGRTPGAADTLPGQTDVKTHLYAEELHNSADKTQIRRDETILNVGFIFIGAHQGGNRAGHLVQVSKK